MATAKAKPAQERIDVLGVAGRVEVLRGMLAGPQQRLAELEAVQTVNEHPDEEVVPGTSTSYRDQRESLLRQERNIIDSFPPKIVERLRTLVAAEQEAET